MHKFHVALISILVLTVGVLGYTLYTPKVQAPPIETQERQSIGATLSVDGTYPAKQISIDEGTTVLQLLVLAAQESNISVSTKNYAGMGTLVEEIGGLKNGVDGKYWHYYVNGALAPVGADAYMLKEGDAIEWRFHVPNESYE